MNLQKASTSLRGFSFRVFHEIVSFFPGGSIRAFGRGEDQIGSIRVINLDRQPSRLRRVIRELRRFRTSEGEPLASIVRRFPAIDARDGREVASSTDVDTVYRMADQLYVQPDARLEACFDPDEQIRMTRQEVAIARSHVEIWKAIASGSHDFVLVLEDDIWFRLSAAGTIDRGWRAALNWGRANDRHPDMIYFSYLDAGGTAERSAAGEGLFRPLRGLWFLSGYVLSREGATKLLKAMPIVGPVDTWINQRFGDLAVFALSSPAILQRPDVGSDNSYSVLPFLARAGIVDAGSGVVPAGRADVGRVLAWTERGDRGGLPMALSMLGLRVRVFDCDDELIGHEQLIQLWEMFDALVDPPLEPATLRSAMARADTKFVLESPSLVEAEELLGLSASRVAVLPREEEGRREWQPLCSLLGLAKPVDAYPLGARSSARVFRDGRFDSPRPEPSSTGPGNSSIDASPWVLPLDSGWAPSQAPDWTRNSTPYSSNGSKVVPTIESLTETFPGNLAGFSSEGVSRRNGGFDLVISEAQTATRRYRSGAFATAQNFLYGRFEAEIKAATGPGLITGFFLHRDMPRQEIDVELAGNDPRRMLVNVFFNPGDEGAAIKFGYRGTPWRVDLGFDATRDTHLYTIDWEPQHIRWLVDGQVVHERRSWDPTPIPHLAMRLYGNLWASRSNELGGIIDRAQLPSRAAFRKISLWSNKMDGGLLPKVEQLRMHLAPNL